MKIQHDNDSYSIVLDNGDESEVMDFGGPIAIQSGTDWYYAFLLSPTQADADLEPAVYKLTKQPTVFEEVEFDDSEEDRADELDDLEDDEDEGVVERSAPEPL